MRAALRFLTILPLPGAHHRPGSGAVVAFPLVGGLLGLAWAAAFQIGLGWWSPLVGAALVLVVDAVLTGALHLDAWGDVADGAASRRPPDEAVRIMREPTVGAVGAAAITLVTLLRFVVLAAAVDAGIALAAAPVAGRTAMVVLLALLPARDDSSLAAAFRRPGLVPTGAAMGLAAAAVAVTGGLRAFAALGAAMVAAAMFAALWHRRFGGMTGDGAGAGGLLSETAALLVIAL